MSNKPGLDELTENMELLEVTVEETLQLLKQQDLRLKNLKSNFLEMKQIVESNHGSIIYIENTVKGYADAYKSNRSEIQLLKERTKKLEIKSGLRAPFDEE